MRNMRKKRIAIIAVTLLLCVCMAAQPLSSAIAAGAGFEISGEVMEALPLQKINFKYYSEGKPFASSLFYSHGLLMQDSTTFSPELAKVSVGLAMAAYSEDAVEELLLDMGFQCYDNSEVYRRSREDLTYEDNDYVAYTIAYQEVVHPVSGETYAIYCVPIQGTPTNAEWFSDFNLGYGDEHEGFKKASTEIYNKLRNCFMSDAAVDSAHRIVWFAGHSRGAACANLLAGWFSDSNDYGYGYTTTKRVFAYTYACPAVSLKADTTLENIYNFNNDGDLIPLLPLEIWGYKRNGQSILLDNSALHYVNFMQQFKSITGLDYAGERVGDHYTTLLENTLGSDRSVFLDTASLQCIIDIVACVLNQQQDVTWGDLIEAYMGDGDTVKAIVEEVRNLFTFSLGDIGKLVDFFVGKSNVNDNLMEETLLTYYESQYIPEEEWAAYLSQNSALISKLKDKTGIAIDEPADFMRAWNALYKDNDNFGNFVECLEAAKNLICDTEGNLLGAIGHGHAQATYLTWINCLYFGPHGWTGSDSIAEVDRDDILSIGDGCFKGCTKLTNVELGGGHNPGGIAIGEQAFANCEQLETVRWPDSTAIWSEQAVFGGSSVSLTITCDRGYIPEAYMINRNAAGVRELIIRPGITSVSERAFANALSLERVSLPADIEYIGLMAFGNSDLLTEVVIPEQAAELELTLDDYAFSDCDKLERINVSSAKNIGREAFNSCNVLSSPMVFHHSGMTVGAKAFANCPQLKEVTWPDSTVVDAEEGTFTGSAVNLIILCDTGAVPDDYMKQAKGDGVAELVIGEGITKIGSSAFSNGSALKGVSLPSTLVDIGNSAFSTCKLLETVITAERSESIASRVGDSAFYNCSKLAGTVDLPKGTTYIGESAFYNCDAITKVGFADTAVTVGSRAFYDCDKLVSINIDNAHSIGSEAFRGCDVLSAPMVFHHSGLTVGELAFAYCPALETVTWPDSTVIAKDRGTFEGDSVKLTITFDKGSVPAEYMHSNRAAGVVELVVGEGISSVGNKAFEKAQNLKFLTLPRSIITVGDNSFNLCGALETVKCTERGEPMETTVGSWAFNECKKLKSVNLPDGTISIGDSAFRECSALAVAELPDTVQTISGSAFMRCTSLKSINLKNVTYIGAWAFYGCSELGLDIVLQGSGVELHGRSFANCPKLENVYCPDSTVIVDEFGAFGGSSVKLIITADTGAVADSFAEHGRASGIRELEICEGVKSVGSRAFKISELEKVTFHEDIASIGAEAFYESKRLTTVVTPERVTAEELTMGNAAFSQCSALTEIRLPIGTKTVGTWAFNQCTALTAAYIPEGVETIGDSAFRECSALAVAELPDTVKTVDSCAFMRCVALKSINIKNVTCIGAWAFYGCSELGPDIVLQGSGVELHGRSFTDCPKLENVYCPDSAVIVDEFGAFSGSGVKLIITADTGAIADSFAEHGRASGIKELEICEGVKSVGSKAFKISELEKVIFHEDIASIGADAFNESRKLTTVVMPERVTAEELTMGNAAFSQCSALTEIRLPIGTKTVGTWAFNKCTALTAAYIPEGVETIGDSAFRECSALAVAELPDTVKTVDSSAFLRCAALKSINLKNVTYIGEWGFDGCSELGPDIVLQGSGVTLSRRAFADCSKLENVYCPDSAVIVGGFGAFSGSGVKLIITADTGAIADSFAEHGRASGIKELEICEGVKSVGSKAFKISELEKVTFHEDIASIGAEAFYESKRLTTVVMPERVTAEELTMGNAAFSLCSALTEIRLPIGTKTVGTWAFNECSSLTAAYIPEGVETIGDSAFRECSALAVAELPDTVKTVDSSAFLRCAALKSINLKNVTCIGEWGFQGCSELGPDIVLQGSGVTLSRNAFANCPKLENVYCPDSAVIVGDFGAFSGSGVKLIITADTGAVADSFAEHAKASGIRELELCEGVKSVGSRAFKLSELEKVTFHEDIASIGADAFSESQRLVEIVFLGGAPSIDAYSFGKVVADCYYPAEYGSWNSSTMLDYGGTLTWIGQVCGTVTVAVGFSGDGQMLVLREVSSVDDPAIAAMEGDEVWVFFYDAATFAPVRTAHQVR